MVSQRLAKLLRAGGKRQKQISRSLTVPSGGMMKSFISIVPTRMIPTGCEATISLVERGNSTTTTDSSISSSTSSSDTQQQQQQQQQTSVVVKKKHVILSQLAPGVAVRAPSRFYDCVTKGELLPPLRLCITKDITGSSTSPTSAAPLLRPLPCAKAACGDCRRCPWMGAWRAGGAQLTAEIKAETLREGLMEGMRSATHKVRYLEPFPVPHTLNSLQQLNLFYTPPSSSSSLSGEQAGGEAAGVTQGGFSFTPGGDTDPNTCAACVLCTLEQKRLQLLLSSWACRLPTSAQRTIRHVLISQPTACSATRSWECAVLRVCLRVERDVHNWGPQSPLCGPSHPPDVLSVDEQGLVEAVLAAAPLVKDVEVLVSFVDEAGVAERLYPSPPLRGQTLDTLLLAPLPLQQHNEGKKEVLSAEPGARGTHSSFPPHSRALPIQQMMECWCDPLQRAARATLPVVHESLWLTRSLAAQQQQRKRPGDEVCVQIPFWRHAGALEAASSVLCSLLFEGVERTSGTTSSGGQVLWTYMGDPLQAQVQPQFHNSCSVSDPGPASHVLFGALSSVVANLAQQEDSSLPTIHHNVQHFSCIADETTRLTPEQAVSISTGAASSAHQHRVLAVLTDAAKDASFLCKFILSLQAQQRQQPPQAGGSSSEECTHIRLVLAQCCSDMKLSLLQHVVSLIISTVDGATSGMSVDGVEAGVADVDAWAASFVGYCVVDINC